MYLNNKSKRLKKTQYFIFGKLKVIETFSLFYTNQPHFYDWQNACSYGKTGIMKNNKSPYTFVFFLFCEHR